MSWIDGEPEPWKHRATDPYLDILTKDSRSDDETRSARAQLCFQPGGYRCSCEELDLLVDIAKGVPGVIGAGLTGGGLGGAVLVLVKEEHVEGLLTAVQQEPHGDHE